MLSLLLLEFGSGGYFCSADHSSDELTFSTPGHVHSELDGEPILCSLSHDKDERSSVSQDASGDIAWLGSAPNLKHTEISLKEPAILSSTDPYISPPPNLPFQPPKIA